MYLMAFLMIFNTFIDNIVQTGMLIKYLNEYGLTAYTLSEYGDDAKWASFLQKIIVISSNLFYFILIMNVLVIY